MFYALLLADDGRYLSSCDSKIWRPAGVPVVDTLPTGETEAERNLHNWRYIDGAWIFDPMPVPEPVEPDDPAPTGDVWDELDAAYQAGYNEGYQEGVNTAYDQ